MEAKFSKLLHSPIVEAIIDIDCDLPPDLDFKKIEQTAKDNLQDLYPNMHHQMFQSQSITPKDKQTVTIGFHQGLKAIQFQSKDKKQLIQFRPAGYSFNRLSPYEGLDEYVSEIKRTWKLFSDIVHPIKIRKVSLRNINRIPLPLDGGKMHLEGYLKIAPIPPSQNLELTGFLNQQTAIEPKSRHQVNILMSTQPLEDDKLPLILDIDAFSMIPIKGLQWGVIDRVINQLRDLKNNVFNSMLTKKCLTLFSHQQS